MAQNIDRQLSLDFSTSALPANELDHSRSEAVLSLCSHRARKEETERARYFSEIIKLAEHLQLKA